MIEGAEPSVAHHVRWDGDGGMGLKPSDFRTVPLTDEQHRWLHQIGEETFWTVKVRRDPREVMVALLQGWTGWYSFSIDSETPELADVQIKLAVLLDYAKRMEAGTAQRCEPKVIS